MSKRERGIQQTEVPHKKAHRDQRPPMHPKNNKYTCMVKPDLMQHHKVYVFRHAGILHQENNNVVHEQRLKKP